MTQFLFANDAFSTLASNITNVATSCTLATGTGALFPNPSAGQQFALSFVDALTGNLTEIVYVTARTGDVLTIVRAQEGTAARAWLAGDSASNLCTAGTAAAFAQSTNLRVPLTADTTFYVSTTGNDSNNGLTNGTPWLTLQHAFDVLSTSYDFRGFTPTISIVNGSYAGATARGFVGQAANKPIIIGGSTPAGAVFTDSINASFGSVLAIQNSKFAGSTGNGITCGSNSAVFGLAGLEFGALTSPGAAHIYANGAGLIQMGFAYTISGGAAAHIQGFNGGALVTFVGTFTITLTGTPTFTTFANFIDLACAVFPATVAFSGSATGVRYTVQGNSVANVSAQGANYLPGNSAGSVSNGGVYF